MLEVGPSGADGRKEEDIVDCCADAAAGRGEAGELENLIDAAAGATGGDFLAALAGPLAVKLDADDEGAGLVIGADLPASDATIEVAGCRARQIGKEDVAGEREIGRSADQPHPALAPI